MFITSAAILAQLAGAMVDVVGRTLTKGRCSPVPVVHEAHDIAEGAGEFARREKARFYRMARRSATECAAILDVVDELDLAQEQQLREGREQLQTIVAMLIGLVKRTESQS
jgi:hypothetical protein